MRYLLIVAVIGVAVLALAQGPRAEQSSMPLVAWMGPDGRIEDPAFVRITEADAWKTVWAKNTGQDASPDKLWWVRAPEIDFTRCTVVGYVRGRATNTNGEHVDAIDEFGDHVRIRFTSAGYQTSSFSGEDGGQAVVSYGLWVIPRTSKAIVIEENVQDLIGKPPIWKEQHRFAGLGGR